MWQGPGCSPQRSASFDHHADTLGKAGATRGGPQATHTFLPLPRELRVVRRPLRAHHPSPCPSALSSGRQSHPFGYPGPCLQWKLLQDRIQARPHRVASCPTGAPFSSPLTAGYPVAARPHSSQAAPDPARCAPWGVLWLELVQGPWL